MRKRICFLGCLTAASASALSGRLYYIQIVCGQALLSGAESQQEIKVQSRGKERDYLRSKYGAPYRYGRKPVLPDQK